MLEKTVEDHLTKGVKGMGGISIKLPSMFYSGIPDRLLLFSTALAVFIETKKPKGSRFEPGQPKWLSRLSNLGFIVQVIYDKPAVDLFLAEVAATIERRRKYEL